MTATYEKIATTTLGSATNTLTFSSIPSTYTDLVIIANVRKGGESGEAMFVTFNGDNGSNYSYTWLSGAGSTANSYRNSNDVRFQMYGQTIAASTFSVNILNIQNYANSTTYKTVISRNGTANIATNAAVALWRNTAAITSITLTPDFYLSPNFEIGCTFTLYGIKAE